MHLLSRFAIAALIASTAPNANAHSWPEELQVIGPNGSYIGDRGFIRGYVARTDPTFTGESDLWLLPSLDARMPDDGVRLRINSSDLLCHPAQRTSNYSNPAYPKLKVNPGGSVAIKYLENGHVTLPWTLSGKPPLGGTVFVYGTTQPSTTEKMADVLEWNAAGTGGDKRGKLLSAQQYDDGRCHQINSCVNSAIRQVLFPNKIPGQPTAPSQEQWCETDVTIPSTQAAGDLTLYWVWQWPTAPGKDCTFQDGKDEYYTSCMDLEIVSGGPGDIKIADEFAGNTLVQENFQTKAVSNYKSRPAFTPSPSFTLENWGKIAARQTSAPPNPSFSSSCSAVLSSLAANAGVPPPSCPQGLYATGELFSSISASVESSRNTDVILAPGVSETFPASGHAPASTAAPAPSARPPHAAPSARPSHIASSAPPAAPAPPAPPAPIDSGTVTATNQVVSTETVTSIVTVSAGAPPPQSGPPQPPSVPPQASGSLPPAPPPQAPGSSPPPAPPQQSGPAPPPFGAPQPSGAPQASGPAPPFSPPQPSAAPQPSEPAQPSAAPQAPEAPQPSEPAQPSGAPQPPEAPQPSGAPPQPGSPPSGRGGGRHFGNGGGNPGGQPHFNTITLGRGQAPSGRPEPTASANASQHLRLHRQHARHF